MHPNDQLEPLTHTHVKNGGVGAHCPVRCSGSAWQHEQQGMMGVAAASASRLPGNR